MQSLAIPTDDGRLEQALNDLDQVMDAWLDAVRDLHVEEEPHAQQAPEHETQPAPSLTQGDEQAEQAVQIEVAQTPPQADNPPTPPAEEKPATGAVPAPKPAPAQTSWRGTIEALSKSCEPGISSPAEPPVATPVAAPPTVSEDEALLASLDPKTAEAVRVMRRLSPGKKSVRELVDEYRAGNPVTVEPTTKKSSWWKRK